MVVIWISLSAENCQGLPYWRLKGATLNAMGGEYVIRSEEVISLRDRI